MTSLERLVALGRELGYEGEDLRQFVKYEQNEERDRRQHEQNEERDRRQHEREIEKEKREAEEKRLQSEREKRETEILLFEKQLEAERERHERDQASSVQQHTLLKSQYEEELEHLKHQKERLALELQVAQAQQAVPMKQDLGDDRCRVKVKGPCLPSFEEGKDDLDAYLRRFELFAEAAKWNRDNWAIILSSHLKGTALEVYSRLSQDDALCYDSVKKALMDRFECTEEGFRCKFRTAKPQKGEQVSQFVTRLKNLLGRWIDLSNCEKTFNGIIDLFISEQFLQSCGKNLQLYLKERLPLTLEKMVELAESYARAHGGLFQNSKISNYAQGEDRTKDLSKSTAKTEVPINKSSSNVKCFKCGNIGHKANQCRQKSFKGNQINFVSNSDAGSSNRTCNCKNNKGVNAEACNSIVELVSCSKTLQYAENLPLTTAKLCGKSVTALRDTGCTTIVVKTALVPKPCFTNERRLIRLANKQIECCPVALVDIESDFFSGHKVKAVCMKNPVYDLMIGNVPGAIQLQIPEVNAVVTRSAAVESSKPLKKLKVSGSYQGLDLDIKGIKDAQEADESLQKWRKHAEDGSPLNQKGNCRIIRRKGLLFRLFQCNESMLEQLVLPAPVRETVMKIAHESPFGGHMGTGKTLHKIRQDFAWPGMTGDINRFCQSCDICQKTIPKGKVAKVPLGEMPLIDTPFKRVAIDLIGPIEPRSENKNRYILTLVDYATRYPEAVALPSVETERVAEALLDIFSRVGVPEELISDRGSQFTSQMMDEVRRLLSIRHLPTTPYHAMGNGLVERYNGVLKSMLKKMCAEQPKLWDRYLPAVLFAYREAPNVSLGFSPFELLYGRTVRGPLNILRELWDKEENDEVNTTYQYVFDLRERLEETCKLAQIQLKKSQGVYKHYYDKKAKDRTFKIGDRVLLLLPKANNKLLLQWKGPFSVVGKKGLMDYLIDLDGKKKIFHANLLKKYHSREDAVNSAVTDVDTCMVSAVISEGDEHVSSQDILLPALQPKETFHNVAINKDLTTIQQADVNTLLAKYHNVMSDVPGKTNVIDHKIELHQEDIVRSKPYKIPFAVRSEVNKDLDVMKQMNIIEPSNSPHLNPMVIVSKPDKSHRICLDFRKLNALTIFDSEPMSDPDKIFASLQGSKFFSKLDLAKGYWQVPLNETSRPYTSFATDKGLFQFTVLPFGLVNAPATFNRLMRHVLGDLEGVEFFLDDILIHSTTWERHLYILEQVLSRLREANLTAKPSKCSIGMAKLDYLGHELSSNLLWPMKDKVEKIRCASRPTTKKELRSFLGLCGYYQKFIPHYATITTPLTDMTKKNQPNRLEWKDCHESSFNCLKNKISSDPILLLPDLEKEFVLQTDASNTGIGVVLLQEHDGMKRPVAFASKKLLPVEQKMSTIERECLGIVWGINKFAPYLYGKSFVLETDHQPLNYLHSAKQINPKLMRWALSLQPYKFRVNVIKGKDNNGADFLSRM